MSNLQLRIVSAIVLIGIVLLPTWYGGWPFRLLAAAIGALVFHEWMTVAKITRDGALTVAGWILVGIALAALVAGVEAWIVLLLAAVPSLLFLAFGTFRPMAGNCGFGMAYATLPAIALALLRGSDAAGLTAIIFLFAVVWTTDILAYFVGRAVGGPKLAPSISPGKTWSGAIGGAVSAVIAGLIVALVTGHAAPMLLAVLALVVSAVSQVGDLFESAFKRRHGVKDSSNLIPGHGGVMDRVDGLVAAAVALYLAGWVLGGPLAAPSTALFGG